MARSRFAALALLALVLASVQVAPTWAQAPHEEDDHGHGHEGEAWSRDPWLTVDVPENVSTIPGLSFRKGDFFVYERDLGADPIDVPPYAVLDVQRMVVGGVERDVILYGRDVQNQQTGSRNAYIEYRDAETFDLIRIVEAGHSTDNGRIVGREIVKEFNPPYREGVFPMSPGTRWSNNVTVTETRSLRYPDPLTGLDREERDTQTFFVGNNGLVEGYVNVTVAGRNVTTLQTLAKDRFSDRYDRHNWVPGIPVPVRIVRYDLKNESNITVLDVWRLMDWSMGDIPTVSLVAEPETARVGEPVTLRALGSDPGFRIRGYMWRFGDPATLAEDAQSGAFTSPPTLPAGEVVPRAVYAWQRPGQYEVDLLASLSGGLIVRRTVNVTILNDPPVIEFAPPEAPRPGERVRLDASGSTDREGPIAGFRWEFSDGVNLTGPIVSRSFQAPTEGLLVVTDTSGSNATYRFMVTPTGEPVVDDPAAPEGASASPPRIEPRLRVDAAAKVLRVDLTVTDPDGVAYVTLSRDGTVLNATRVAVSSFTVPLASLVAGENAFVVEAWDKAGDRTVATLTHTQAEESPPAPPSWRDRAGLPPVTGGPSTPSASPGATVSEEGSAIPLPSLALAVAALGGAALALRRRS